MNEWRDKEAHRHDSLLNEIEHAIDSYPYLAAKEDADASKATGKERGSQSNKQTKAHQEQKPMDKITASIEKDLYLAAQAQSVESLQHDRHNERVEEQRSTQSMIRSCTRLNNPIKEFLATLKYTIKLVVVPGLAVFVRHDYTCFSLPSIS